MRRVIIIGAGAAGMMAAIAAARKCSRKCSQLEESAKEEGDTEKKEILLLEKNEKSGKKLYITGKGRCNLTNAAEEEEVFRQIVRNPKFLYSSLRHFNNQDVMEFFRELGLPLKIERGNRVFPQSDKSSDVIKVLNQELFRQGIKVCYQTEVREVCLREGEDGKKRFAGVLLQGEDAMLAGDALIIATGGLSYPSTGSTGDGYRFAKTFGHQILPTRPSLVSFEAKEDWIRGLSGLSLKNISISLWQRRKEEPVSGQSREPPVGKKLYEEFGEMLFTHFGVSGPVILSASSVVGDMVKESGAWLFIDLKPAISKEQLDNRLLREFDTEKNKAFKNSLDGLLPKSLVPVITALSGIPPEKKVNMVTKKERQTLCNLLKGLPITITGLRGYAEAVITRGGVSVKEIDPKTMGSKKVSGVYFAGEVLDVDAMTGGYNLQIAWSTGYTAGEAAAEKFF